MLFFLFQVEFKLFINRWYIALTIVITILPEKMGKCPFQKKNLAFCQFSQTN